MYADKTRDLISAYILHTKYKIYFLNKTVIYNYKQSLNYLYQI